MSDLAIQIAHLGKRYRIGPRERYRTLRDVLADSVAAPLRRLALFTHRSTSRRTGVGPAANDTHIWALQDVSFDVKNGEVVGIIGRNGAGKSTLLKILSRITEPTTGYADIYGRVGSLLEVGTGFHPELTGRENIYLNGAILGMRRAEIERKFDEIVAFAEVDKFLDMPVKHYSSGMYVRLAFAVAAHLEPEILLVDEVLAVGDVAFQKKCMRKMGDVAQEGRTVLFVSHNMAAIQSLCARGCLLENGRLVSHGPVDEVITLYLRRSQEVIRSISLADRQDRSGNGALRFTNVTLLNKEGEKVTFVQSGEELTIALDYTRTSLAETQAVIRLAFTNMYGQRLFLCFSRASSPEPLRLPACGQVRCIIPRLPLLPGVYHVSVWCKIGEVMADNIQDAFDIEVVGGDFFGTGKMNPDDGGNLLVEHRWEVS